GRNTPRYRGPHSSRPARLPWRCRGSHRRRSPPRPWSRETHRRGSAKAGRPPRPAGRANGWECQKVGGTGLAVSSMGRARGGCEGGYETAAAGGVRRGGETQENETQAAPEGRGKRPVPTPGEDVHEGVRPHGPGAAAGGEIEVTVAVEVAGHQ